MSENQIVKVSENTIVYPYGTSIKDSTINNCPIEVFKPQSIYYKSIMSNINDYKNSIERLENKLKIIDDVKIYVNSKFNDEYEKSEIRILNDEDISDNEREEILNCLVESVTAKLEREYYKLNNVCAEMKDSIEKEIEELKRNIDICNNDLIEWKEYCLEKAKEEEKELMIKYLQVPHNNEDVIRHLQEFVSSKINEEFTALIDEYYEMYECKFNEMCRNKYQKTIKSVFNEKSSTKVMDVFSNHNQLLKNKLNFIIQRVQFNNSESYKFIEDKLKTSFDKFISDHYYLIYEFLRKSINNLATSTTEFTNSTATKLFAQSVIKEINQFLINNLNSFLNQNFNLYIETLMEKLGVSETLVNTENRSAEVISVNRSENVKSIEMTLDSFIQTLPDEYMDVKVIVDMYNNYFGTSYNSIGFSKLKGINDNFMKQKQKINGKFVTLYRKIN